MNCLFNPGLSYFNVDKWVCFFSVFSKVEDSCKGARDSVLLPLGLVLIYLPAMFFCFSNVYILDAAVFTYQVNLHLTVRLSFRSICWYTWLLWCSDECNVYSRIIPVYIGVIVDQTIPEQRFLIHIKFDSDLVFLNMNHILHIITFIHL